MAHRGTRAMDFAYARHPQLIVLIVPPKKANVEISFVQPDDISPSAIAIARS
jgi:hypothetical protein